MKQGFKLCTVVMILFLFASVSHAAVNHTLRNVEKRTEVKDLEEVEIRSLYVTLEEAEYRLDEMAKDAKVAPYAREGKIYIPLNMMEEAFYTPITWDLSDYSAVMVWQGNALKVSLPESKIYYQGVPVGDISADILEGGVITVPIAEILSVLNIPYQWLEDTSSLFLYQSEEKLTKQEIQPKLVTEEQFVDGYLKYLEAQATKEETDSKKSLVDLAKTRLGMPYVGGAAGPYAFDCSGFVHWVLTASGEKSYVRGSSQSLYGLCDPVSAEELKVGDLVFFTRTYSAKVPITHSAIYIGEGMMIHAAGNRVQITPLVDQYWTRHFYGFGRMR